MTFMFVPLREGRVPWRRCAHVHLRYWHSGCIANHADLVVNGNFVEPSIMSSTEVEQTTDSIDRDTNEQIWQVAYLHSAAFGLSGRKARWLHQHHDVLKPGTCKYLIGRVVRVGLLRIFHGIVYRKPSHMVYCL